MSKFSWNDQQLEAIQSRGSTILVSAAAGSGKTAVLVERIIREITDEANPANIEDFLIVTFTKAAASQMKEKISDALTKKIAENPDNMHLRECRFKLPFANISTIDSFAISLVRDNFNALGISPDFTILDAGRKSLIEKNAISQLMEEFHNDYGVEFEKLNDLLNNNDSDSKTEDIIIELYNKSMAQIFPEDWLFSLVKPYETIKLTDDPAVIKLFERIKLRFDEFNDKIDYCFERLKTAEGKVDKVLGKLEENRITLNSIISAIETRDWKIICKAFSDAEFSRNDINIDDSGLKNIIAGVRNEIKDYVNSLKENCFSYTQQDVDSFKDKVRPSAELLIKAVIRFREILDETKRSENAYYYDDILHFTLNLLVRNENGKPVRSELAKELSENYKEIFVDEYQDVNAAQDMIFEALSRDDKNRFLVGDIKQSIYGFRNAMPEVFLSLRDNTTLHPDINRIYLNNNYRSREEVTDTVNYIFSKVMSENTGDVDYDEREFLYPSAPFDKTPDIKIEFDYLNCGENSEENIRYQALYAVKRIKKAIKEKMQIVIGKDENDRDETRDVKYSDFAILYRNKSCGKLFAEVFEENSIPYISDNDETFINSPEINFIKCLLRVIDNPTDDIALATVMLSPVYGFTPDDLALMRAGLPNEKERFFKCVLKYADSGNKKAKEFVSAIEKLRRIATVTPAGEFTADIIDETGLWAIVSKMRNPNERLANINSFINLANSFESTGIKGLAPFVRFVMKLEDKDVTVSAKTSGEDSDCVKMMTIHKSKGLEFPIVILANTERKFNTKDQYADAIISPETGLALKYIEENIKYKSLYWELASYSKKVENISEELRNLYVALTRAKERLMILSSPVKNGFSLKNLYGVLPGNNSIYSGETEGYYCYAKIIGSALISHPDAHVLKNATEGKYTYSDSCDTRIDFNIIEELEDDEEEITEERKTYSANPALLEEIKKRLEYRYPYESLNRIRAKAIASNLGEKKFNRRYFASSTPSFALDGILTGAQKGTATHRFMQFCDFTKASTDAKAEAEKLLSKGKLTRPQADCLDFDLISKFFDSDIAKRIMKSDNVYREYQFTASLPVSDLYPDADSKASIDEVIIIEGVIDCAFEENGKLVILDFKTDYAENENQLIEEYAPQLETYRKCLSKVMGKEVSQTLIYSFRLGKEITIA